MRPNSPRPAPLPIAQEMAISDSNACRVPSVPPSALVALSSIGFTLMNTIGRDVAHNRHVSFSVVTMSRGVVQLGLCLPLLFRLSVPKISGSQRYLLALRALLGGMASICRFSTLAHMKAALATALNTTVPVFAILFGAIFLRRSVRKRDILAIFFCSSGATLIAYDSVMGLSESLVPATAVVTGLSSAALTAGAFVAVGVMGAKVHFILNVFVISIANILVPIATVWMRKRRVALVLHFFQEEIKRVDNWSTYYRLGLVGILGFCAASCLNKALQSIHPSRAATIRSMDIPVNALIGYILLAELPSSPLQFLGCALVTAGAYTSAANKTN